MEAGDIAESGAANAGELTAAAASANREPTAWWRSIYLTAPLVLVVPFLSENTLVSHGLYAMAAWAGVPGNERWHLLNLVYYAMLVIILVAVVRRLELRDLKSIGVRMPRVRDILVGLGGFLAIGVITLLWIPIVKPITGTDPGGTKLLRMLSEPNWFIAASAIGAALFEELYFRGYAIERFGRITGSLIAGAAIGLLVDLYCHLPYWGIKYVIVIAAGQAVLAALYLWRRNVAPGIIAHVLWDIPRYSWGAIGYAFGFAVAAVVAFAPARLVPASFYEFRASNLMDGGHVADAIAVLTTGLERFPGDVSARQSRAYAYFQKKDYPRAIDDLNRIIARNPRIAQAFVARGEAYYYLEQYPRAVADFNRALAIDPKTADAMAALGDVSYVSNDCDAAIADYRRALAIDPAISDAWMFLGGCLNQHKQYWAAGAALLEATFLDPRNTDLWHWLAVADIGTGTYGGALDDYDHAIAINPGDSYAYLDRAQVYLTLSDYRRALADFRSAIRIDPKRADAYNAAAWLLATCPDQRVRDGKQAQVLARIGCDLSAWKSGQYLDTLAAAYAETGDFDEAVHWERKAIALMPPAEQAEARPRLKLYEDHRAYHETNEVADAN